MKREQKMRAFNLCGSRVRVAREAAKMKQVELAAAMSVDHSIEITQTGISDIEQDRRHVKDFELLALAEILNVAPLWLLTGVESLAKPDR